MSINSHQSHSSYIIYFYSVLKGRISKKDITVLGGEGQWICSPCLKTFVLGVLCLPTTVAPWFSTSLIAAFIVPPVSIHWSTIRTRRPELYHNTSQNFPFCCYRTRCHWWKKMVEYTVLQSLCSTMELYTKIGQQSWSIIYKTLQTLYLKR